MRILAIDPGVTSGFCKLEAKVLTPEQHMYDVDEVWDYIDAYTPDHIICEDFEFRGKARTGLVLFSVQLIGVVRLYEIKRNAKRLPCTVFLQKAAQGKAYYTNKQLKDLKLYKPGAAWEHSMDATRHLMHWLTFGPGYRFIEGKRVSELGLKLEI